MRKGSLRSVVVSSVLVVAMIVGILSYSGNINNNSTPTNTTVAMPTPTAMPTIIITPIPTSNPTATPSSGLTVTYSEQSRNQAMIVIQFKLEPNSYIFQMNATSFILTDNGARVSANANDAVIIGTQYTTLFFPISGYNGTDYHLSSDVLPLDTVWIKQ